MARTGLGSNSHPYKLLLLEMILQAFSIGLLIVYLPESMGNTLRYGLLAALSIAIVLRTVSALGAKPEHKLAGSYGQPANHFELISVLLLGFVWGGMVPLIDNAQTLTTSITSLLPIMAMISGLAIFSGSAFNTRLLTGFVITAFTSPILWYLVQQQTELVIIWSVLGIALLVLSQSGSGLDELIKKFTKILKNNASLIKNLAKTRDKAIASQKESDEAHQTIKDEIAERKKIEEQIKASERELSRILDDMMDTYFQVDQQGNIQLISPSVENMLGYTPDESFNKPWKDFFAVPNDHSDFLKSIKKNFGALQNHEVRLRHQKGHDVWVTLNAYYREDNEGIRNGFEGIVRDTSEDRKAKESLHQEKELWRVTLESIADGVITTDINGRVNHLNPAAENMTGWNSELAQFQPLLEVMKLIEEDSSTQVNIPLEEWLHKGRRAALANPAMLVKKGDTSESAIELSGSPIRDSQDVIIGSVMVFHDVTKLRSLAMQLSYQATHDALTGLINRVEFDTRVEQAIHTANRNEKQHALFYIDLDQFKFVNDTCGHPAGDELLKQVTRLFRETLRESDVLARLGGDEFGVLVLGCPLKAAEKIAEKLRKQINDFRFRWENTEFRVGVSIGIVAIYDSNFSLSDIMKSVDAACYVAKERGRNRVHVYEPDDAEIAMQHGQMQWMQRIQRAIEKDEFVLYSQRIKAIEGPDNGYVHAELLLRMVEHKGTDEERIIPPDAFLPAAERYHLMPQVDRWVLRNAMRLLATGGPTIDKLETCTINLSGQSMSDLSVYDYIVEQIEDTGVDPKRLCFEITESAVIANMEFAQQFVNGLRSKGCRFALDDFGSGLSTFDYLKQLPVDYVKLDGSLVRDIDTNRISQAMVHAINYVAHIMGMKSIAEYVESEAILDALRKLRIDYAQGYAIDKPSLFGD